MNVEISFNPYLFFAVIIWHFAAVANSLYKKISEEKRRQKVHPMVDPQTKAETAPIKAETAPAKSPPPPSYHQIHIV